MGTTSKGDPFHFPMPGGGFRDRSEEFAAGVRDLGLARDLTFSRLDDRRSLLESLDAQRRHMDVRVQDLGEHYHAAFDLLTNARVREAFDINVPGNQRGVAGEIDRDVVAIFKKWGFAWGGDWAWTDPMHFELAQIVREEEHDVGRGGERRGPPRPRSADATWRSRWAAEAGDRLRSERSRRRA